MHHHISIIEIEVLYPYCQVEMVIWIIKVTSYLNPGQFADAGLSVCFLPHIEICMHPSTSLQYWGCGDSPCWKSFQASIVCEYQLAIDWFLVFKVQVHDGYFCNGFGPQVPLEMMGKWLITTVWSNNKLLGNNHRLSAYKFVCCPFPSSGWMVTDIQ